MRPAASSIVVAASKRSANPRSHPTSQGLGRAYAGPRIQANVIAADREEGSAGAGPLHQIEAEEIPLELYCHLQVTHLEMDVSHACFCGNAHPTAEGWVRFAQQCAPLDVPHG